MERRESGYTLVELVVVVAIIASISSLAVYAFVPALNSYRLKQATYLLVGAIREAQVRAVREGRSWRVLFDPGGTRYRLQVFTADGAAPVDCTGTGWETRSEESLPPTYRIVTEGLNRSCINFSPSGRAGWENPHVVISSGVSTVPIDGDSESLELTDSIVLNPTDDCSAIPDNPKRFKPPGQPQVDPPTVVWYHINQSPLYDPKVVVDLGDRRFLSTVRVGVYANLPTYKYVSSVTVEGTNQVDTAQVPEAPPAGITYEFSTTVPGPTTPPRCNSKKDVAWVDIPINGAFRFLRFTLTRHKDTPTHYDGLYVVLHEIQIPNDLEVTVSGAQGSKQLVINSVTGNVSVR